MNYKAVYAMVHDKWVRNSKCPSESCKKNTVKTETFRCEFSKHVADAIAEKGSDFKAFVFSVKMKRDTVFCLLRGDVLRNAASNLSQR